MHGLINRSIQNYVRDSYGTNRWEAAAQRAGLDFVDFEAMLSYDDAITPRVLDAVAEILKRPRSDIMEDIGAFLVSHHGLAPVRRLLRFGGVNFDDFLHSLDDLPDRARLAVADLLLPRLELREHAKGQFSLICDCPVVGYGFAIMGLLRAMADDYGALALLEHTGAGQGIEILSITLIETDFADGRSFELGARTL